MFKIEVCSEAELSYLQIQYGEWETELKSMVSGICDIRFFQTSGLNEHPEEVARSVTEEIFSESENALMREYEVEVQGRILGNSVMVVIGVLVFLL